MDGRLSETTDNLLQTATMEDLIGWLAVLWSQYIYKNGAIWKWPSSTAYCFFIATVEFYPYAVLRIAVKRRDAINMEGVARETVAAKDSNMLRSTAAFAALFSFLLGLGT